MAKSIQVVAEMAADTGRPGKARRRGRTARRRTLVLFPGALGDFLCCQPALAALHAAEALTLCARPELFPLVPVGVATVSIDRREIADLFAASPLADATRALLAGCARVESFTGYGDANFSWRLAEAAGTAVSVHRFRGMSSGEHAASYYARCLGVTPLLNRIDPPAAAARWAAELWQQRRLGQYTLAVHPGSGSPRKNWEGMADLAAVWRERIGPVLTLLGPAEPQAPSAVATDLAIRNEPLDRVAALLQCARAYAGNDSGISHLAGLAGTRGVAFFGPTDPQQWRPLGGSVRVLHAPEPCSTCGPERFCTHRLPVARAIEALLAVDAQPVTGGGNRG